MRRAVLGMLAGLPLAARGTGGTPPRPPGYVPPALPGQAPGSTSKVVRARLVIVSGPSAGVFVYNGNPGVGNLIESMSAASTDPFGNQLVIGVAAYGSSFAVGLTGGLVQFYTGSLAGGWTATGNLAIALADGHLIVNFGNTEIGSLLTVDGNATIAGTLSVNGSTNTGTPAPNATSTNGLPNGGIQGNSGPASTGTAHTHTAGGYSVTNGQHSHDIQNHLHAL